MRKIVTYIILSIVLVSCSKEQLEWGQVEQLESNTTAKLNKIIRVNDSVILAAGGEKFSSCLVLRSSDNGSSWQLIEVPEAGKGIYGLSAGSDGIIYGCGYDGKLIVSDDDGKTWSFYQMSNWLYNVGVSFPSANNGIVISTVTQDTGFITHVDASGAIKAVEKYNVGFNDIMFTTGNTGFISGMGAVLRTDNGGNNWVFTDVKNDNFVSLCSFGSACWTCGNNGSIWHSGDAGSSWECLYNGNSITRKSYRLRGITFADEMNGFSVGEKGTVIYTQDGGKSWQQFKDFTSQDLYGVLAISKSRILVCGTGGVLYSLSL